MKNLVKLIAPAKVNLVLAVGEQRPDGFHEVHTIMHALALHDTITMRRFGEDPGHGLVIQFSCETSGDIDALEVPAEENIAYCAVVELAQALNRKDDETLQITLSKSIPAQAGLGGGSSNAAAALLGAATLWGVDPGDPRVLDVARGLGADVPFFLHGGCVRLSGKGDELEGVLEPRRGFVLLVRPDAGVPTKDAYAAFDADPQLPDEALLAGLAGYEAAGIEPFNNMEQAACAVAPQIADVLAWGRSVPGAESVLLCGSGSAVCVVCDSYEAACAASVEAHRRGWWARSTSFSPLGAAVVKAV